MTCYIVGAGEFFGAIEKREGDLIIAADGGYDTLRKLGIAPDLLIGDMDSRLEGDALCETIVFPVKKDETDSFLAYREGVRRGYTEFKLYGGVGGREDHTFANLSLLIYAKEAGHSVTMYGNGYEAFAIKNEEVTLCGESGSHFSAFAFGGEARGVTIRGLEYEARDISLSPSYPLAVSNRFCGEEASVEVKDGVLLIIVEKNLL